MKHSSTRVCRRSAAALVGWAALLILSLSACTNRSGGSGDLAPGAPEATAGPALTTGSPIPMDLPGGTAGPKPVACPRLESILYDTTQAPDPPTMARQLGMILDDDGRVLVLISLVDSTPLDLNAYTATVTGQAEALAQAFVPFDQLCALSNDARVLMVRLASRPEPS